MESRKQCEIPFFHEAPLEKLLGAKLPTNYFDFLRNGVEIRFSNFRLSHFEEFLAISRQNDTSDEIDRVSTSDKSTPSGAN